MKVKTPIHTLHLIRVELLIQVHTLLDIVSGGIIPPVFLGEILKRKLLGSQGQGIEIIPVMAVKDIGAGQMGNLFQFLH